MLKPWREVAEPHQDVLKGSFQQAEFAADLARVHEGTATPEYQNAALFFERTFITEGMRLLLISLVKRLMGQGGDPVIQLQTAFGGGKTHTMLAVYHIAKGETPAGELQGVSSILDEARVAGDLPRARIAVIDGNKLAPNQPQKHGKGRSAVQVKTMWGELAWQLGGAPAYDLLKESDESGTSPGKAILAQILREHAPCVILMDELVAFVRQFDEGKSFIGGTYDSNLSFVQALTEALKEVPNAVMFASLPESDKEAGSQRGVNALKTLEHYFARVQALWKPVATEEAFEIVRRRLFTKVKHPAEAEQVCRAFADYYTQNGEHFPRETQESRYFERIKNAYPIHPEIFDRLYEDWSTLEGFQRTRGVLKLMAKVIHRLWVDGNTDPLIMPGSFPLEDADTRNEVIYYLPQGWDAVIERDIDGPRSETAEIDGKDTRFGSVQGCKRVARTIFLGSAPSTANQGVRGLELERVLLGSVRPDHQIGTFKDALRRLSDRLHYLNIANNRFWFDVRPNLRREMEDRKRRFQEREDIFPVIQERLRSTLKVTIFQAVHIFTTHSDIPDDRALRLVVLSPESTFSRQEERLWRPQAEAILQKRGELPRHHQNRLIFLVADQDVFGRLKDLTRVMLSWESIVKDCREGRLNLDQFQLKQAEKSFDDAKKTVHRTVSEAYKWLIAPNQEARPGRALSEVLWEHYSISAGAPAIHQEIERILTENEVVISAWSPIHLINILKAWFWKERTDEVKAIDVWQSMCRYLYLSRLKDEGTFNRVLSDGSGSKDFFGFASAKDEIDRYIGFSLGKVMHFPMLDTALMLIKPSVAAEYEETLRRAAEAALRQVQAEAALQSTSESVPSAPSLSTLAGGGQATSHSKPTTSVSPTTPSAPTIKRRFYGSTEIDPVMAKKQLTSIVDEILMHFTSKPGVKVRITVDIEADSPVPSPGFDAKTQRDVKENCNVMKFKNAEFDDLPE